VAQVDRPVGIGQGTGDQDGAGFRGHAGRSKIMNPLGTVAAVCHIPEGLVVSRMGSKAHLAKRIVYYSRSIFTCVTRRAPVSESRSESWLT
jgi:hypothetical protein